VDPIQVCSVAAHSSRELHHGSSTPFPERDDDRKSVLVAFACAISGSRYRSASSGRDVDGRSVGSPRRRLAVERQQLQTVVHDAVPSADPPGKERWNVDCALLPLRGTTALLHRASVEEERLASGGLMKTLLRIPDAVSPRPPAGRRRRRHLFLAATSGSAIGACIGALIVALQGAGSDVRGEWLLGRGMAALLLAGAGMLVGAFVGAMVTRTAAQR
jgi:hypothetical protein